MITRNPKHKGDLYHLNCLNSFRTENRLKAHEKVCKNKDFCGIVMTKKRIIYYSSIIYEARQNAILYVDLMSLIKEIDGCANNPEKSSTAKIGEHIPCRKSMSIIWAFDKIKNKLTFYCGEDCMKKFCISLSDPATNVINFENKNATVNKEELKSHQDAIACYVCGKRFSKKFAKDKIYQNVRDHCHFTGKHRGIKLSICNLRFNVLNQTSAFFQNESNRDYHFIIKELAKQ